MTEALQEFRLRNWSTHLSTSACLSTIIAHEKMQKYKTCETFPEQESKEENIQNQEEI